MYKSIVQSVQSWVFYILVGIVESFSGEKHSSLQKKNMYIVRPRRLRRVHQPELRRLGPGKFHYGYDVPNVIVDVSIQMVISGSQFVSLPEATASQRLQPEAIYNFLVGGLVAIWLIFPLILGF